MLACRFWQLGPPPCGRGLVGGLACPICCFHLFGSPLRSLLPFRLLVVVMWSLGDSFVCFYFHAWSRAALHCRLLVFSVTLAASDKAIFTPTPPQSVLFVQRWAAVDKDGRRRWCVVRREGCWERLVHVRGGEGKPRSWSRKHADVDETGLERGRVVKQ